MTITTQIKIIVSQEEKSRLYDTLSLNNECCNYISEVMFQNKTKSRRKVHDLVYHECRVRYPRLASQMVVNAITKTVNSYASTKSMHKLTKPFTYKRLGAIIYDSRQFSYITEKTITISLINKDSKASRTKGKYIVFNEESFKNRSNTAILTHKKGKFYLQQCVDQEEIKPYNEEGFLGCDRGSVDIVYTSHKQCFSSKEQKRIRANQQKVYSSVQSKRTRSSRKLLKRLSTKRATTTKLINHKISKDLVLYAKERHLTIVFEDLTNILKGVVRGNRKYSRTFRKLLGNWSFAQLEFFVAYKCRLYGVPFKKVNAAWTSQTCYCCGKRGKRKNKVFTCTNTSCDVDTIDADYNAAINIAKRGGAINCPEIQTFTALNL